MDDVIHLDEHGNEVRNRRIVPIGALYAGDSSAGRFYDKGNLYNPRRLACSNGHESTGAYVQMIGDRAFCIQCWGGILAAFGAEMHEVKEP